jgi:asparagine synthase (glutamine-hydrolysing)
MCGIAGFVGETGFGLDERREVLGRMLRSIAHRGPDDEGLLVEGEAAVGMRRLSIIDLAGGHQPLSGCDPRLSIVFNGEVYNFRELKQDLEARGHTFKTHSDTEAIVHAFEEYGPRCVERLRGMFGLALWDARDGSIFVARDRVGKKPLYYTRTPRGALVFGSELKCLLAHPEVGRETSPEALDAYLTWGYVPDPLSVFKGIEKLPPGHYLTFKGGELKVEGYWDFPQEEGGSGREEDYLEELRELLDEAVRVRLVADVPLGAFLSGGVDSSAVVGLMARNSDRPVKTFSIGFNEDSYDELKYARVAARHFQTEHHEFVVTPDICSVVDELAWHFDEPFADPSAIPTYVVSKLARSHVKVVLSGDGGDELFAGYTRYVIDRRRGGFERLPRFVREGLMQPAARLMPHGARGRNFIHDVAYDALERYLESVSVYTRLMKTELYTEEFRRLAGDESRAPAAFRATASASPSGDALDRLLYLDSKTYLPGDILTKVDRMSMAASLEARTPLLDHKLIEFVGRIPSSLKMKGLVTKHIFKQAVRGLVPSEILDRPKQGFGVPIEQWINRQLRDRVRGTLTEARTLGRGVTDPDYVALLLDEHEGGRRDHSARLWALFMLELWHRTFVDDGGAAALARAAEAGAVAV